MAHTFEFVLLFCKVIHGDSVTKPDYYYYLYDGHKNVTLLTLLYRKMMPKSNTKTQGVELLKRGIAAGYQNIYVWF